MNDYAIAAACFLSVLLMLCIGVFLSKYNARWIRVISDQLIWLGMVMIMGLVAAMLVFVLIHVFNN